MCYINEPDSIDFYLDPKPLTTQDRNEISEIIAYYKLTGRKRKIKSKSIQKTIDIKRKETTNFANK
jgi:hypothetical protein